MSSWKMDICSIGDVASTFLLLMVFAIPFVSRTCMHARHDTWYQRRVNNCALFDE